MTFDDAVARLENALRERLPGADAHARLAPRPRGEWPPEFDPARMRHAAGLVLIFPIAGLAHLVLTVRAHTLGRHGGQVSLPGGVIEPGETFEHAALREAYEEIALDGRQVRVLGALTPLDIPVSGFRLHPIVSAATERPALVPAKGEVARILEIPIERLLDPTSVAIRRRLRNGRPVDVPAFVAAGVDIWGATAMILAEFLVLLGWGSNG